MLKNIILTLILGALLASACSAPTPTAQPAHSPAPTEALTQAHPESSLPPAEIANDEGGPEIITGEFDYSSYTVNRYLNRNVLGLIDASYLIEGDFTQFVPSESQILGMVTSPVSPAPLTFQVRLPIIPPGASIDVDNDGEQDTGIQAFAAAIGPNFYGDITLQPFEQDWFHSYLKDPQTGTIREGYFLLYAPDDAQGFPAAAGEDGVYFTADEPIVGLPAGYTVAVLNRDGTVTFDRSRQGTINMLEEVSVASPDFSDQGILQSYNSLIDLLKIRYAYTELRGLDWEAIRETYLPQVEAADEAGDTAAYYAALQEMALSIRDAHVSVAGPADASVLFVNQALDPVLANLGAQLVELDDGRFIVTFLDPEGPGAAAGWQFGTEIISVDGIPTVEHVQSRPFINPVGTQESLRLARLSNALKFPEGSTTTIEYRLPGQTEVQSATLTPEVGWQTAPEPAPQLEEISFSMLDDGVGYIQWRGFTNFNYKVAVFEEALSEFKSAPGIIIDLRGNSGGNVGFYFTLASYFFTADDPGTVGWIDEYSYDEAVGDLVQNLRTDYEVSSPRPDITYQGPVVVLVDEHSASAGEYFPQFLQTMGRAVIVGEHATEGAGGFIERVSLPGGLSMTFTKGRTYFAGTDELNLEAKGVTLDVDVPTTEENERAKLDGVDVVLAAGLEAVAEEGVRLANERLPGSSYELFGVLGLEDPSRTVIENPSAYTITFGEKGQLTIQADCNAANATYIIGSDGVATITVGPTTLAACPEGSLSEPFLTAFDVVTSIEVFSDGLSLSGVREDGQPLIMAFTPAGDATEE